MPGMPVLPSKQHQQHRRSESHPELKSMEARNSLKAESSVRGGNIFQSVFSRKEDHNLGASQSNRRKFKSMDSSLDELDGTLRRGLDKGYSPDVRSSLSTLDIQEAKSYHQQRLPDLNTASPQSYENEDVGLDLLLASASTNAPSHFPMHISTGSRSRAVSAPSHLFPGRPSMSPPLACLQEDMDPNVDVRRQHSQQLQFDVRRQHSQELQLPQPASIALQQRRSQPPSSQQQQRGGGQLGMLLAAQLETDGQQRSQKQQQQQQQSQSLPRKGFLDQVLHDPNHNTNPKSSSLPPKHNQKPPINPEMRKTFTEFHNTAKFARDSTSPFLGDDPSHSLRHDSYVSYHSMQMRGGGAYGSSVPHHGTCV
jgi:hypothetical protein